MTFHARVSFCVRCGAAAFALLLLFAIRPVEAAYVSGVVLTTDGAPAVGYDVVFRRATLLDVGGVHIQRGDAPAAALDVDGRFTVPRGPNGPVTLAIVRSGAGDEPAAWIHAINLGDITMHVQGYPQFAFTLRAGSRFENVTITIAARSAISGKVLDATGAPVTNRMIHGLHAYTTAEGKGSRPLGIQTDATGRYVTMIDRPGEHTLTLSRGIQVATSGPVVVARQGEDADGIDLVLSDPVLAPGETTWVERPATGRRYRVIDGGNWRECYRAASVMASRLVTITSEDEKEWLEETFGTDRPYWIGLTAAPDTGEWRWVTREPFDYANWREGGGEPTGRRGDYAFTNWSPDLGESGLWSNVDSDSAEWRSIRYAIVEEAEQSQAFIGTVGPTKVRTRVTVPATPVPPPPRPRD